MVPTDTYRTQRERERLQDVQHGLQHAAAPQQMGEPGNPTGRERVRLHEPPVTAGGATFDGRHSRLCQAREIFVGNSANPFVCVIKVDQQKLGVPFQLFLVLFGFWLKRQKRIKNRNAK